MTRRSPWPLLAWVTGLGVAIAAFSAMGSGPLAAPALTEPGAWSGWAGDRDPVVAVVALLRLLVLALAWYLLLTTLLGIVGHLSRSPSALRATSAVSPQIVRRVLRTSLGAGVAAAVAVSAVGPGRIDHTTLVSATAAEAPPPSSDAPRMRPLPPRTPRDASRAGLDDPTADATPPAPSQPPATTPDAAAPTPDATTPAPQVPSSARSSPPTTSTVTVEVGDHLWSIAETQVRRHVADPPDRVVGSYWRRVVAVNRDRLVDPANPDLVLPGQQFVLPPLDGEVAR